MPLAVKIAPDLSLDEIDQVAASLIKNRIDGVIATNTTLEREMIYDMPHAAEAGGLSGRPLQHKSTEVIRHLAKALDGALPIIGVGGIDSAMAARENWRRVPVLSRFTAALFIKGRVWSKRSLPIFKNNRLPLFNVAQILDME